MLQIVGQVRTSFRSYKTLPLEFRIRQLNQLTKLLQDNKTRIMDALYKDLNKVRELT